MATDAHDSRRRYRRSSSPEEVERSSKRHKHRHHSHRHHRHRHGSKRHDEESKHDVEGTLDTVPSSAPAPNSDPDKHVDDVEEGEILEEEGFGSLDGEIGKKRTESDAESGEIKVTGDRYVRSDRPNMGPFKDEILLHHEATVPFRKSVGIDAKSSKASNEDIGNNIFINPALDGENGTFHLNHSTGKHEDDGFANCFSAEAQEGKREDVDINGLDDGYLDTKFSKENNRKHGEPQHFKGNEKLTGCNDNGDLEVNEGKVSIHRYSSSESGGEKYRASGSSPSRDRYRSRSRSSGHVKDRSRSHSIIEEYAHSKRRDSAERGSFSNSGRDKIDHDHDEERMVDRGSERGCGSLELLVDDRRERSTSHRSRETRDRDSGKDRDVDRDLRREKERERNRYREISEVHGRERERERSYERDRRDRRDVEKDRSRGGEVHRDRRREKERDRSLETMAEKDRRREKERDRSRDRTKGGERDRDWQSERDKIKERGREKESERRDDRYRHKDRDTVNNKDKHLDCEGSNDGRGRYRQSRYSRHAEAENQHERKKNFEPVKTYNSMGNSVEGGENELERGEDEHDDLDEKVTLQVVEQEEEELNRLEESRRRREAILQKYKMQQQQSEQVPENQEKDKEPLDIPAAIPEVHYGKNDGVDVFEVETSFAVGKSPPENDKVTSEKVSGAAGLGEGTPKSERSDDKFCDDIFGETPTGVRKSGKGDGLHIERGGLLDNWDDAEGYYSYRFGEILDGRYEVTAAHGKGVFSTVVRAKNLKAGNSEPEEVAIKIIRNNDTMYKAGMDELVILKKLVGADPDDKRHCVRFLSSFKYRNHLCLVFESLHMNLREVLKKFGRNIGLRLTAVRAYAKQLFIALKHLRNCGVLHCDIKPDNMLVNEAKNVLKLCDFGNAMFAGKNEVTPYLVSRFYRAPEIILGLPYDHPLDIWSVGCCLYELYTGKVLFPGPTNNDMLRLHMELKGPLPKKMLRKGAFTEQHFDQDLNFLATEEDPVTKKTIKRMILNIKPKDIGTIITGSPGEDPKMLANFKDLLEKIFVLDPDKRLTVSQALNHPFITGK